MNNSHNNGTSDESLNTGLVKLGQAYGRLDQDEPPALLDQAILNSAQRAVEKNPRWIKFNWLHGLTTTAVFILAFSVILNQQQSSPRLENGNEILESVGQQNEQTLERMSHDVKTDTQNEIKREDVAQQYNHQGASAISELKAESAKSQPRSQVVEYRLTDAIQDEVPAKAEPIDQDKDRSRVMRKDLTLDKAGIIANTPEPEEVAQKALQPANAALVKEPDETQSQERQRSSTQAELIILQIIEQKRSGDPGWQKELASFIESYPDFPVPDELKLP